MEGVGMLVTERLDPLSRILGQLTGGLHLQGKNLPVTPLDNEVDLPPLVHPPMEKPQWPRIRPAEEPP